mgnify:CR=1 FL=1
MMRLNMSGGTANAIVGAQREIVVQGRQEQAPATIEAYGVDSTLVLPQPPLLDAQRVHKVLHNKPNRSSILPSTQMKRKRPG